MDIPNRAPEGGRRWALLLTGILSSLSTLTLTYLLIPRVAAGLRTFSWQPARGIILSAGHVSGYWPGQTWRRVYRERLDLSYAYTPSADPARHLEGWAFDAKPGTAIRGWVEASPVSAPMAKVALREAPDIRVYYDPRNPERAVVVRGIPFDASILFMLMAGALAATIRTFRILKDGGPARDLVGAMGLYLFGGGLLAFGGAYLTAWTFGVFIPWWLLAGYAVTGFLAILSRDWNRNRLLRPMVQFHATAAAASLIGAIAVGVWSEDASPGYVMQTSELPGRLANPHPSVRIHALGWIQEDPAGMPLATKALEDPDPGVRKAAITAVQFLARKGNATDQGAAALVKRLQDPEPSLALRAAWALINVQAYQPRMVARDAMAGVHRLLEGDPEMQVAGLRVLGLVPHEAVPDVSRIAGFLASPHRDVRGAASHALGLIGPGASSALGALESARAAAEDTRERQRFESAIQRIKRGS